MLRYLFVAMLSVAGVSGATAAEEGEDPPVINGCPIWSHTRCPGGDLRHANLAGKNLAGADFRGARMARVDLRGAMLAGANFDGADLTDRKSTRLNSSH